MGKFAPVAVLVATPSMMTPTQVEQAQNMAREWKPKKEK
jgi:hypothetical protein